MKRVEHRTLECGLELYVMPSNSPVVHFQLFTPFGSDVLKYMDAETGEVIALQPGSAHYFEHTLFFMPPLGKDGRPIKWRTNTPKKKSDLREGLTEMMNNNAIIVNAYTGRDITSYYFITRKNQIENLEILLDFVFTPYFPQDRFRKEVGTILDEARRGENSAQAKQYYTWKEQTYQRHGSRFPIVGTLESIPKISLEDVLSMHDTFYRPSNMFLVVTGNVDIDEIADGVTQKLESLGKGTYKLPPEDVSQNEPYGVVQSDNFDNPLKRADVARPNMLGGWKYILEPTKMTREELIDRHVAVEFVGYALFGPGSANREQLIKDGMDERTFGGGGYNTHDNCFILVSGNTDDPEGFREIIVNNAQDIVRNGISEEEVDYAKNSILTDNDGAVEYILQLGRKLSTWGALTRDPADYFRFIDRVETITAEEINAFLPEILEPDNLAFTLMVPDREE